MYVFFSELKEKKTIPYGNGTTKAYHVIPTEPYPVTFRADTPSPVDLDKQLEKSGTVFYHKIFYVPSAKDFGIIIA